MVGAGAVGATFADVPSTASIAAATTWLSEQRLTSQEEWDRFFPNTPRAAKLLSDMGIPSADGFRRGDVLVSRVHPDPVDLEHGGAQAAFPGEVV